MVHLLFDTGAILEAFGQNAAHLRDAVAGRLDEIQFAVENARIGTPVGWVEVDLDNLSGSVTRLPMREDIDMEIQEQLIVELYSK